MILIDYTETIKGAGSPLPVERVACMDNSAMVVILLSVMSDALHRKNQKKEASRR